MKNFYCFTAWIFTAAIITLVNGQESSVGNRNYFDYYRGNPGYRSDSYYGTPSRRPYDIYGNYRNDYNPYRGYTTDFRGDGNTWNNYGNRRYPDYQSYPRYGYNDGDNMNSSPYSRYRDSWRYNDYGDGSGRPRYDQDSNRKTVVYDYGLNSNRYRGYGNDYRGYDRYEGGASGTPGWNWRTYNNYGSYQDPYGNFGGDRDFGNYGNFRNPSYDGYGRRDYVETRLASDNRDDTASSSVQNPRQ